MRAYQSNQIEWLADRLGENVYEKRHPFDRPWVVVPNAAVKELITHHLAKTVGIATGIRFLFLEEALSELAKKRYPFPSRFELALKAGKVLEKDDFGPITDYIKKGKERTVSLALALADPLMHWGVYGGSTEHAHLVEKVYEGWEIPHKILDQAAPKIHPPSLHLFGFYHLPPLYFRYLYRGSLQFDTCLYLFSPCAQFWTDTLSEKEAHRLEVEQETNPLLGDWGRLIRRLLKMVEEVDALAFEYYPAPAQVEHIPRYKEYLGGDLTFVEEEMTTLKALQCDLLLMRPAFTFQALDDTLKVHAISSRLREVEICADEILRRKVDGMLVMAPDITPYVPYIVAVFEREGLPYRILDIASSEPTSLEYGLLQLLSLPGSRWEPSRLFQLFCHPLFAQAQSLSKEELALMEGWIAKGGIRWGKSEEHWRHVLHSQYGVLCESGGEVSWESGFARLFRALTCVEEEGGLSIELSQAETLGKLCLLVRRLDEELSKLDKASLTLEEWAHFWTTLSLTFFGKAPLFPWTYSPFSEERFSFAHLKPHLEQQWNKQRAKIHSHKLEGTLFCSFLPMHMRPCDDLVLLGMDEGAFPRRALSTPFKLSRGNIPSPGELDRTLFLEALCSAKKSVAIFYTRVSTEDGLAQNPSPLVADLISYIGNEGLVIQHKGAGYDQSILFSMTQYKRAIRGEKEEESRRPLKPTGDLVVDVRDLKLCASDPLRLHFKHLGLDPGRRLVQLEDEEAFHPSALETALATWSKAGHPENFSLTSLLCGPFGPLFSERVTKGADELRREIEEVTNGDLHTLLLAEGGDLPPLDIPLEEDRTLRLVGKIGPVTSDGLLIFSKGADSLIRALPQFLAFVCLIKERALPYTPHLHLVREGKTLTAPADPLNLLKRFLHYHLRCIREPSPLSASIVAELIRGKVGGVASEHAGWIWKDAKSLDKALLSWEQEAHQVFGWIGEEFRS